MMAGIMREHPNLLSTNVEGFSRTVFSPPEYCYRELLSCIAEFSPWNLFGWLTTGWYAVKHHVPSISVQLQ